MKPSIPERRLLGLLIVRGEVIMDDVIAAIATAPGEGGIGIVRISGKGAVEKVEQIFYSPTGKALSSLGSYMMTYGYIVENKPGAKAGSNPDSRIDEVIVSIMLGPKSFTGEDVVEINCHGGMIPLRRVLEEVLRSGARMAEPGEFSKRAFLNGRIDLAQAESILDVIRAQTDVGLKVALKQLEGGLSIEVVEIRKGLLELLAFIEAGIDFPEDDIEELSREKIRGRTVEFINKLKLLVETADSGKIYREGLSTVIVGKPNVGKSSLLNALLKEKRAIVTDIPGTTRDVIEEVLNLQGIPVRLVDTAGIRATEDVIEKLGVERSKEWFGLADLVLLVLDAQTGLQHEDLEIASLIKEKRCLVVINKIDVGDKFKWLEMPPELKQFPKVEVSVKEKRGLQQLEEKIVSLVLEGKVKPGERVLVTNLRHKRALEKAVENLNGVIQSLDHEMPTDCMSIDFKGSLECLGEVTGESIGEDIINEIFAQFCLGK
ncbi:MAG: tRNA uridine-5-carboxymethylaminomethyl(34) synthesis GTPase MnmE [Carboxydocellales bacterium]